MAAIDVIIGVSFGLQVPAIIFLTVLYYMLIKPCYMKRVGFPSYWSKSVDDFRTVDITENAEFIKNLLHTLWSPENAGIGRDGKPARGKNFIEITAIQRVENLRLFSRYNQDRNSTIHKGNAIDYIQTLSSEIHTTKLIKERAKLRNSPLEMDIKHDINEHYLFHGTSSLNVESICKDGFNVRYACRTMFGKGIYTAENPTKSDQYTDDDDNYKQLLLCRADLGEIYITEQKASELSQPPCRTCKKQKCTDHDYTFDSAVGDIPNYRFREFIVYNNHKIYPEYIITYNHTADSTEYSKYKLESKH